MSEKLYLIRVDMERFIGPLTLKEVRDSYRRMEFGLQDEIASSNKPWVAFDDLERINRIYPELGNLIKKEMLSGWGSTEPDTKTTTGVEKVDSSSKKTMGLLLKILAVLVLVVVALGAFFIIRGDRIQDIKLMLQEPTYSKAVFYFGDRYNTKFEAYMDQNAKEINKSMKKKRLYNLWLPYVRAVAFSRNGDWSGLNSKKLRGKDANHSPMDCSLATWKNRWEGSRDQWQKFIDGRALPNEEWAKILVWDVTWIKQRLKHRKWIWPKNYYEACFIMARKALRSIKGIETSLSAKVFDSRLKWAVSLINDEDGDEEFEMLGSLWSLSCIESSTEEDAIKECVHKKNYGPEWTKLLEERSKLRKVRLILANNSVLSSQNLDDLKSKVSKLSGKDGYTRFDYRDEIRYFQTVIQVGGALDKADAILKEKNIQLEFDY